MPKITHLSEKWCSADVAVADIYSGQKVFVGSGAGVPRELVQTLTRRQDELEGVHIHHILTMGTTEETAPYTLPGMEQSFTHYAWFIGPNTRAAVNEGRAYFIPAFLSAIPDRLREAELDRDFLGRDYNFDAYAKWLAN